MDCPYAPGKLRTIAGHFPAIAVYWAYTQRAPREDHVMYELIQAGENTFYIDCPTKLGVFLKYMRHICSTV